VGPAPLAYGARGGAGRDTNYHDATGGGGIASADSDAVVRRSVGCTASIGRSGGIQCGGVCCATSCIGRCIGCRPSLCCGVGGTSGGIRTSGCGGIRCGEHGTGDRAVGG